MISSKIFFKKIFETLSIVHQDPILGPKGRQGKFQIIKLLPLMTCNDGKPETESKTTDMQHYPFREPGI